MDERRQAVAILQGLVYGDGRKPLTKESAAHLVDLIAQTIMERGGFAPKMEPLSVEDTRLRGADRRILHVLRHAQEGEEQVIVLNAHEQRLLRLRAQGLVKIEVTEAGYERLAEFTSTASFESDDEVP